MSTERNKTYALGLLIGALTLLALCTAGLEGHPLTVPLEAGSGHVVNQAAIDHFGPLFSADPFASLLHSAGQRDVFLTTHFEKPPAPPPEPPKPKTKTVELTFMGTLESSDGDVVAFLRLDQDVSKVVPGSKLIQDWGVAAVDRTRMVVTNATVTNQIAFQQSLKLTVPLP